MGKRKRAGKIEDIFNGNMQIKRRRRKNIFQVVLLTHTLNKGLAIDATFDQSKLFCGFPFIKEKVIR
jgi:hypothetical protein